MNRSTLEKMAGDPEYYPELEKLIDALVEGLRKTEPDLNLTDQKAYSMVGRLMEAMAEAEVHGLITSSDEHEYAAAAIAAYRKARGWPAGPAPKAVYLEEAKLFKCKIPGDGVATWKWWGTANGQYVEIVTTDRYADYRLAPIKSVSFEGASIVDSKTGHVVAFNGRHLF